MWPWTPHVSYSSWSSTRILLLITNFFKRCIELTTFFLEMYSTVYLINDEAIGFLGDNEACKGNLQGAIIRSMQAAASGHRQACWPPIRNRPAL